MQFLNQLLLKRKNRTEKASTVAHIILNDCAINCLAELFSKKNDSNNKQNLQAYEAACSCAKPKIFGVEFSKVSYANEDNAML